MKFITKWFGRKRPFSRPRFRPGVERLEDKAAPTDIWAVLAAPLVDVDLCVVGKAADEQPWQEEDETAAFDWSDDYLFGRRSVASLLARLDSMESAETPNTWRPTAPPAESGFDQNPRTEQPFHDFDIGNILPEVLPDPLAPKPKQPLSGGGGSMPSESDANTRGGGGGAAGSEAGGGGGSGGGGGGGGAANSDAGGSPDMPGQPAPTAPPSGDSQPEPSQPSGDRTTPSSGPGVSPQTASPPSLVANYAKVPIQWEPNRSQTDPAVKFLARGTGYSFFLTGSAAVMSLARRETGLNLGPIAKSLAPLPKTVDVLALNFVGANSAARFVGQDELPSRSNYFIGSQQLIDLPNYGKVQVAGLYAGVDAVYYSNETGKLEFDFVVAAGADYRAVQMDFQGTTSVSLNQAGDLRLQTNSGGEVFYRAPVMYQMVNGVRQNVTGRYVVSGLGRVGFEVDAYDPGRELIIDPVLEYSSYLGGSGDDEGLAIAVDGAGNAYIAGKTLSSNFPVQNPFLGTIQGGTDVFVTKLSAAGNALVYSTYIGGSSDEQGNGIAVDLAGNAFVVGTTASSNFPTTTGAYQTTLGGSTDAFVVKLSTTGDSLHYGTYAGGSAADTGTAIAVDPTGRAFFTGDTAGSFPTTTGAYDTTYNGNSKDVFVAALNAAGSARVYATYLGGGGIDTGYGIAVDPDGNAYVTGSTNSGGMGPNQPSFPTVNPYQSMLNGMADDAFVTKLNSAGSGLTYSTYFGGSSGDGAYAIAINADGNAFITGGTGSTNFPTASAAQSSSNGGGDAFATKFSTAGNTLVYSTYLGGTLDDQGRGIAVTLDGRATIVGTTNSTLLFPTTNAIYSTNAGGYDAFVTRLAANGASWDYSTYLGGSLDDQANGVAVDVLATAFVAGTTRSTNFPTKGPYQSSNAGGADAFVTKLLDGVSMPAITDVSSDTGSSATDRITTDQTLGFSGTAPANSGVTIIRRNVGEVGTVSASGTGTWSFDYSATTLPEGSHAFVATATVSGKKSDETQELLVHVDLTAPTVAVSIPATTANRAPQVSVTARDVNGIPNGTQVRLDVDLNNDGDYIDTGETSHTTGTITDGFAVLALSLLAGAGTYRVRARATDLAGHEGTSTDKTFTVTSATAYSISNAQVRTADPFDGMDREQLGNAQLVHALDLDRSPGGGQAGDPSLVYNSDSVSVKPIVQATVATRNDVSLPSQLGIELTWNGVSQGAPVYYNTTGLNPGDSITIAAQVNSAVTTTGRYPWSITVYVPGSSNLTSNGTTFVRAEDASSFGAGWTFSPVSRLFDIPADANGPAGKLWLYGTGGYRFFQGTTGTFTSPAEDNGTFVKNGDNTFTYTTPEQAKINFDSGGYQTSVVSPDTKETITFTWTSGRLSSMTAIDGASTTFTYGNPGTLLSSIATAGSRTFTSAVSGTDLQSVTDPDTRVHSFTYDIGHHLTRETRGALQNQFRYASNGRLDQTTWGISTSPTVTNITPAVVRGLGSLSRTTDASVTDALNHVVAWQLDAAGRPLGHVDGDGAYTAWVRDTAGRVSSVTDPLGRVTTYTRDAQGYVTREDLPGGANRQYAYHATYHGLTTFTNERGHTFHNTYDAANGHLLTTYNNVTDVYANVTTPTTTFAYNTTTGLLDTITDPESRVTTLTYLGDGSRRLWKSTTQLGTDEYGYDATSGEVSTFKDAKLRTTTTTTDAMGRPLTRTDPASNQESWVYLTSGLLEKHTDREGTVTKHQYDANGRALVDVTLEAQGTGIERTTLSRYNNAGQLDGSRDAGGGWTTFTLDPVGRVIKTTDALGGTTARYFDIGGQLLESRDQLGNRTRYAYNNRGWITQVTDPRDEVTAFAFDNAGNRTSVTDPLNNATTFENDEFGRARKVTDPRSNFTTTVWWGDGRVKEIKDARGYKTQVAYDFVNKKITTTEAVGTPKQRATELTLDEVGNVVAFKDALNHTTSFTINAIDEVTKVTDALSHETNYTLDKEGRVTAVQDALLKTTTFTLDQLGRQTKQTDPLSHSSQTVLDSRDHGVGGIDGVGKVSRDAFDNLGRHTFDVTPVTSVTRNAFDGSGQGTVLADPVSNRSAFVQDQRGQQTKETDPLANSISRIYDDAGRVTSVTDRKGRVRDFSYFNDNRLQQEIWRDSVGGPAVNTITYTYDADGRVLTATDNDGTYTFTYDELGRVATQQDPWGITLTYTWDAADRLTQVSDTKGGTRTYEYDNANRNTVRKFSATGQEARLDLIYNDRNQVTEVKRYNDLAATQLRGSTVYAYDDAGRVASITHKDGSATTIDSYTYQYDNADRVTQETSTLGPTRNYSYDADGQLLSDGASSFTYDKNGNRTNTGYVTGTGNRLTTDGTWNYTYDDEGNLISKSSGSEVWTFGYDQLNHTVWAEKRVSGALQMRADYKFDVFGNRIEKAVDPDGSGPQATVVTKFTYERSNAWGDLDSANALTTRRLYLDAVDSVFAKIGSNGNEDWYLADRLGSVRDIANSSGSIIDHLDYAAFGKVATETQPANGDRYAFTARERDSETGLNYYRNRMLDPDTGRFTGEDQSGFGAGDPNLYRLVNNNPANFTDPSGLVGAPGQRTPGIANNPALAMMLGLGGYGGPNQPDWARRAVELLRAGRSMQDVVDEIGRMPEHRVGPRRGWLRGLWQDARLIGRYVVDDPGGALAAFGEGLAEGAQNIGGFLINATLFIKGFGEGIKDGTTNVLEGLGEMILHPVRTVQQAIDFFREVIGLLAQGRLGEAGQMFIPESVLALANGWDSAGSHQRGYLIGKVVGEFGTGILLGAGTRLIMGRVTRGITGRHRPNLDCPVPNSFVAGTLVLMADRTSKPIETIVAGDWVWASDPQTGEEGPRQVVSLIVGQGQKELIEIGVKEKACGCGKEKGRVTATHDHPFWVESVGAWVDAKDLKKGDALLTEAGKTVYVSQVAAQTLRFETVYNLTIEGLHTYYVLVGDQPVLVHNCPTWGRPEPGQPHGRVWEPGPRRPRPTPHFETPTNPPQLPPRIVAPGFRVRRMPPTAQYPHGYWVLEGLMPDGIWHRINPRTMRPGPHPDTHIPFPAPVLPGGPGFGTM
jgi:RHS repeat-associated protein